MTNLSLIPLLIYHPLYLSHTLAYWNPIINPTPQSHHYTNKNLLHPILNFYDSYSNLMSTLLSMYDDYVEPQNLYSISNHPISPYHTMEYLLPYPSSPTCHTPYFHPHTPNTPHHSINLSTKPTTTLSPYYDLASRKIPSITHSSYQMYAIHPKN